MFEKISKKQLTGAILAGVLTVAGATSAFAADLPNSNKAINVDKTAKYEQFHKIDISKMSASIKSALDGLVSAGTITQAQADAVIKEYTPGEGKEMHQIILRNPIDALVTSGNITQAQADAINTEMKTMRESKKTPEDVLKGLVSAGTITQTQADAVLKCFIPEGRKFDNFKYGRNPLSELLTSGTLTQTQMDSINKAIKTGIDSDKSMKEVLDGLVAAGTVTQAQEDAILKVFPAKVVQFINRDGQIGFLDKLVTEGTVTQAQADTFNAAMKSAREAKKLPTDILKELVAAGTITQTQADAIQKIFTPFEGKGLAMRFKNNPLDKLVSASTITQAQADAINAAIKKAVSQTDK